MAYFGAPDGRFFNDGKSGLHAWPENAQGYRLFAKGNTGAERIGVQLGRQIELQLTDGKGSRIETPEITIARTTMTASGASQPSPDILNLAAVVLAASGGNPEVAATDRHRFSIKGAKAGVSRLTAYDAGSNAVATLDVVVGDFGKHPTMDVDLIAETCASADSLKIHALQRMLNNVWLHGDVFTNKDNIFEQHAKSNLSTDPRIGDMTCGIVARYRGDQVFAKTPKINSDWYTHTVHEPLRGQVTKRSEVKYKSEKITALTGKIVKALRDGNAVRVAVLDSPVGMTPVNGALIAYHAGGHTVLIVGCNKAEDQFLYIDPWGAGSMMEYKGGIPGNRFSEKCAQIGLLRLMHDPDRRAVATDHDFNMLRGPYLSEGSFTEAGGNYLEVIAAPF
jgi:hypothetical protein